MGLITFINVAIGVSLGGLLYTLAGTLFLVVSVHSLLLLGHGHGDDFLPRPGKKEKRRCDRNHVHASPVV